MINQIWINMGFIRWPISFSLLVVCILAVVSAVRLFASDARADQVTRAWVDAILFWGGFAMISGILGTLVGITIAAQSIEAAGAVSATLVWGGIKVALLSSAFGTLILAGASLLWFGFQLRWRMLKAWQETAGG